ncbi:MAG: hypothetical protein AAGD32_00590 [Planctomycetota bacterium]
MNISPTSLTRISQRMRGTSAIDAVHRQNAQLLRVNQQIATGKRLLVPSDDAADAGVAKLLRKRLETDARYMNTLDRHVNQLSEADRAMGDATTLLRDVHAAALNAADSGANGEPRGAIAAVVDNALKSLVSLANTQVAGSFIFAGDQITNPAFEEVANGVVWRGGAVLANDVDTAAQSEFTVSGVAAFGGLAGNTSTKDLNPDVTLATRLSSLNGTSGNGVTRGSILLSNGTVSAVVDLSTADSLGDVVDAINNAGVGAITAALNATGDGLAIGGGAGDAIEITDLGSTTAADLGIEADNPPGVPVVGSSVQAKLDDFTPLATLNGGSGIDLSGLNLTLGNDTFTVDLTTATTIGDLRSAVSAAVPELDVRINADGDGIELLNPVQGRRLGIGENGGTTAADLGIRSFDGTVALTDLDDGRGVPLFNGGDDLRLTDSLGIAADVDLTGSTTVQDVINAINAAPVGVTATFNAIGNGITLTDTAGGGGTLATEDLNGSRVSEILGFDQPPVANVITGVDPQRIESRGVFNSLAQLSEGLRSDDIDTIRIAAAKLEEDIDRIIAERGRAGAITKDMIERRDRIDERQLATQRMLSDMEDIEYGEAVAHYQTLTTAIEATYRSTSSLLNLSLLNFL